jgi:hypothetical protein
MERNMEPFYLPLIQKEKEKKEIQPFLEIYAPDIIPNKKEDKKDEESRVVIIEIL